VKVRLDPARCVGHGRCYALAPEVFGEDDRGHCLIEQEGVPPELEEQARAAVLNCPEDALQIVEDGP
jgi:ferredoxin